MDQSPPSTVDTTGTAIGVLHTFGYDLHVSYREDANGTRRFAICALGGSLSDTPLGEVGLTRGAMLYPDLNTDAKHLGFDPGATGGGVLMRFLVELSVALDGDALSSEWDFTPDPASPIPSPPHRAPIPTTAGAAWAR